MALKLSIFIKYLSLLVAVAVNYGRRTNPSKIVWWKPQDKVTAEQRIFNFWVFNSGHVRVGPDVIKDPAFIVTRNMEDFVTWVDTSAIRKRVLEYKEIRDDYDIYCWSFFSFVLQINCSLNLARFGLFGFFTQQEESANISSATLPNSRNRQFDVLNHCRRKWERMFLYKINVKITKVL